MLHYLTNVAKEYLRKKLYSIELNILKWFLLIVQKFDISLLRRLRPDC